MIVGTMRDFSIWIKRMEGSSFTAVALFGGLSLLAHDFAKASVGFKEQKQQVPTRRDRGVWIICHGQWVYGRAEWTYSSRNKRKLVSEEGAVFKLAV